MKLLDLKLRIIVLWIWAVICMAASLVFELLEPARLERTMSIIEDLVRLDIWLIIATFFGLIPLIMAFLTVVLKDRVNRLTNKTLSIIYAAIVLWNFIQMLLNPAIHQIIIIGSVVVVSAYLIFYSWKWPVKEA